MNAPVTRHLEPVDLERGWVETFSYEVHEPRRSLYERADDLERRSVSRSEALERLRALAALVWYGWLILAGVTVGGTAMAVLARVAFVVLRWAVSA